MKAYYHSGQEIAQQSGYRSETLKSLEKCSHYFLLQVWEAMFMEMLKAFITTSPQYAGLLESTLEAMNQENITPQDLLLIIQELATESLALEDFNNFIVRQAEADDTWHLWSNFVLKDCFSYVSLFLAIRTSNWDLRFSSLKNMAPLFSAYDRPCYQKLIPSHIADIECYDKQIIKKVILLLK